MCIIINSKSCWGVTSLVTSGLTRSFSLGVHGIRTFYIRYSQIVPFIWPIRLPEGKTICLKNTAGMGLNDGVFSANLSILENQGFQIFCCSVSLQNDISFSFEFSYSSLFRSQVLPIISLLPLVVPAFSSNSSARRILRRRLHWTNRFHAMNCSEILEDNLSVAGANIYASGSTAMLLLAPATKEIP